MPLIATITLPLHDGELLSTALAPASDYSSPLLPTVVAGMHEILHRFVCFCDLIANFKKSSKSLYCAMSSLLPRIHALSVWKECSIGLRSGEYGGKYSNLTLCYPHSSRTPSTRWMLTLSMSRCTHCAEFLGEQRVPTSLRTSLR
jgi:hypothetical protein